jgi:hypothetical protein
MRWPRYVLIVPFALVGPVAHADIYACTGKNGMTVYQNFSCDVDSIGASGPKKTVQSAEGTSTGTVGDRTARTAIDAPGRDKNAEARGEPRIGMSTKEVQAIWGKATSIYSDELVDGRVEIWKYDDFRAVHFDPGGRVVAIDHHAGH